MYQPCINWNMMALHTSQFVWYRRLFVIFSQFTFVNTWIVLCDRLITFQLEGGNDSSSRLDE